MLGLSSKTARFPSSAHVEWKLAHCGWQKARRRRKSNGLSRAVLIVFHFGRGPSKRPAQLRVARRRDGTRLSAQSRLSAKCCRWRGCLPFENDDWVSQRQNLQGKLVLGAE